MFVQAPYTLAKKIRKATTRHAFFYYHFAQFIISLAIWAYGLLSEAKPNHLYEYVLSGQYGHLNSNAASK